MSDADLKLSLKLAALAGALDDILKEQYGARVGFVLLLAPFNQQHGTEVQYISNIENEQAREMIRTLLARWQAGLQDVPTHHKH